MPDVAGTLDVALDDGQPVAVQGHNRQAARLNDEQLAGVGGLFVVLADSIDGFFDHLAQHAALDGHRIVGAGHGQARIIAGVQRGDLKFCHTAADFCLALVVQLNADIAPPGIRLTMALSSLASSTVSPGTSTLHSIVVVMPISIS